MKELIEIPADVYCLFSAISCALYCSDSVSSNLRSQAVECVKENFNEGLSQAVYTVHGMKTLDDYVAHMSRDGTFVDETEVRVTRPFLIFSGHGKLISSHQSELDWNTNLALLG